MKKLIQITLVLLLVTSLTGCIDFGRARATTTVRESLDHIPASALSVESRNGGVEVVASPDYAEVDIEARIHCSGSDQQEADERVAQASLEVARGTSRELVIRPVFPGGARGSDGARIVIHLPDVGDVNISTTNGPISVTGGGGEIDVTSSNGRISIAGGGGVVVARTTNGSVRLTDHTGKATVRTTNGSVGVERQRGSVDVSTSNASIVLTDLNGAPTARTTNGSITVTLQPEHAGPVDLRTSNAPISITAGPALAGTMTLSTSNSSVIVDDETGTVRLHSMRRTRAELTMNGTGQHSTAHTTNGRVTLKIEP
jgi:ribosomal protein S11